MRRDVWVVLAAGLCLVGCSREAPPPPPSPGFASPPSADLAPSPAAVAPSPAKGDASKATERRSRGAAPAPAAEEGPVAPPLIAFLSKARSAHHEADLAEDSKDVRGAIAALTKVTDGPVPGGASPSPEIVEVMADTRARLADLRSQLGDLDAALRDIAAGLAAAPAPTHFRGHLFEVRGIVLERRFDALKKQGDAQGAARAKREALDAFDQAIAIQNEVIEKALRDVPAAP